MRSFRLLFVISVISIVYAEEFWDLKAKDVHGNIVNFKDYQESNPAILIVNVASYCGYTNQYKGLELIYKKYKKHGFEVFAFPCNQFFSQEPDPSETVLANMQE